MQEAFVRITVSPYQQAHMRSLAWHHQRATYDLLFLENINTKYSFYRSHNKGLKPA